MAHCFAMLLFLQQRDGNAPQTAALCHRLLEMTATQPARAADMEVAANSRQCTHGFAAGECTHPACEAAFEATNPTRGRRSGHAAQLRSSTTSKSVLRKPRAGENDPAIDRCLAGGAAFNDKQLNRSLDSKKEEKPTCADAQQCQLPATAKLRRISDADLGAKLKLPVFIDDNAKDLKLPTARQATEFDSLLCQLGQVFGDKVMESFHVFVAPLLSEGEQTTKIAFNRGGSLFFSLSYHMEVVTQQQAGSAASFWFVVVCHELAHNQEEGHGKPHEALLEKLMVRFMTPVDATPGDWSNYSRAESDSVSMNTRNTAETRHSDTRRATKGKQAIKPANADFTQRREKKEQAEEMQAKLLASPDNTGDGKGARHAISIGNRTGMEKGNSTKAVPKQETIDRTRTRGVECKCGYTCGTRKALESHVERFPGSKLHGCL